MRWSVKSPDLPQDGARSDGLGHVGSHAGTQRRARRVPGRDVAAPPSSLPAPQSEAVATTGRRTSGMAFPTVARRAKGVSEGTRRRAVPLPTSLGTAGAAPPPGAAASPPRRCDPTPHAAGAETDRTDTPDGQASARGPSPYHATCGVEPHDTSPTYRPRDFWDVPARLWTPRIHVDPSFGSIRRCDTVQARSPRRNVRRRCERRSTDFLVTAGDH